MVIKWRNIGNCHVRLAAWPYGSACLTFPNHTATLYRYTQKCGRPRGRIYWCHLHTYFLHSLTIKLGVTLRSIWNIRHRGTLKQRWDEPVKYQRSLALRYIHILLPNVSNKSEFIILLERSSSAIFFYQTNGLGIFRSYCGLACGLTCYGKKHMSVKL
jgi:hypothetical protein